MAHFLAFFTLFHLSSTVFRLEFPINNLFSSHSASIFLFRVDGSQVNGSSDSKHQRHYGLH